MHACRSTLEDPTDDGIRLQLPATYALIVPAYLIRPNISELQRTLVQLLSRLGSAPLPSLQDELKLNRSAARREVNELVKLKLVETVRDGRGQAFRLA